MKHGGGSRNQFQVALSKTGLWGKLPKAVQLIEHIDKLLSKADTEPRLVEPSSSRQ